MKVGTLFLILAFVGVVIFLLCFVLEHISERKALKNKEQIIEKLKSGELKYPPYVFSTFYGWGMVLEIVAMLLMLPYGIFQIVMLFL